MSESAKHQSTTVPDATMPDVSARTSAPDAASAPGWTVVAVDHVQLAMPVGGEELARWFYVGSLGLVEVPKPPPLAARGGCWFERGHVRVHLGVEVDFVPARKAHPALVVAGLDVLVGALERTWGLSARWSDEIPGTRRCHVDDPFGNRIELIEDPTW